MTSVDVADILQSRHDCVFKVGITSWIMVAWFLEAAGKKYLRCAKGISCFSNFSWCSNHTAVLVAFTVNVRSLASFNGFIGRFLILDVYKNQYALYNTTWGGCIGSNAVQKSISGQELL